MKILVTGGSGFIGRHVTKRLVDEGHEVTITSSGSEPKVPGVSKILYYGLEGIDWRMIYGQDVVIHQMANNDTRCKDESEMFRANVFGPIKMFVSAYEGGCRKFVYASSCAVYGASPAPYVEGVTEEKPLNVYGQSKVQFDQFAMKFAKDYNVSVTGLRYANVYGPGEELKGKRMSMIGQMCRDMLKGKPPALFAPGDQRRDWVFIKDVVEANMLAMTRSSLASRGNIYNIGSGTSATFNELFTTIREWMTDNYGWLEDERVLQKLESPKYVPCPFTAEYQSFTQCDIEKLGENFRTRRALLYDLVLMSI